MSESGGLPTMYFSSLTLNNIKCFGEKETLDLTKDDGSISPWTLILGNNGTGKTTLLKSLAWMQPVQSAEKSGDGIQFKPLMDEIEDEEQFNQLIRAGQDVSGLIEARFSVGIELGQPPTPKSTVSAGMALERIKGKIERVDPISFDFPRYTRLNLFAYGASRHMGLKNYDKMAMKPDISNLFSSSGDLYDAEEVLSRLEYGSLKEGGRGKATDLFKKVKEVMADLLPDVPSPDSFLIKSPVDSSGTLGESHVEINTLDGEVPLYELSLGYKTMLAWAVDLAVRMASQNPESAEPLSQPAVVLIDEIDLHLHPTWQRSVREYLVRHFPKTQFICTAHSPFMAQSSEAENLVVLHREGNTVTIESDPFVVRGWRIGQVATSDLFGVDSERSPEIEALFRERTEILGKNVRTPADNEKLDELDAEIANLPGSDTPEDQAMRDQIRNAYDLMKSKGDLS